MIILTGLLATAPIFAGDDIGEEIRLLEAKKQALLDSIRGVSNQKDSIRNQIMAEYEEEASKIDAELVRIAEMDENGRVLSDVKKRRLEEKKKLLAEYEQKAAKEIKAAGTDIGKDGKALYEDIVKSEKALKKTRTITSKQDERLLQVLRYAGDKFYWNTQVSLYINDDKIFSQKADIKYETLAKKAPANIQTADSKTYNDYLDTVDYYDAMLRSGDDDIILEIDYSVEAKPITQPSTYTISILGIRYVDARSKRVIQSVTPEYSSYNYKLNPAVDISEALKYYSQVNDSNYQYTTTNGSGDYSSNIVSKNKTLEDGGYTYNTTTGGTPIAPVSSNKSTHINQGRYNLGFTVGSAFTDHFDIENGSFMASFYGSFPLSNYMFCQIDVGWIPLSDNVMTQFEDGGAVDVVASFGMNYTPSFASWLNFYGMLGAGVGYTTDKYGDDYPVIVFKSAAGIDITVANTFVFTVQQDFYLADLFSYGYGTSVGFAINMN